MDDATLPQEVRRLIEQALASMDHVEVLFRIHRAGEADADALARDAHIEPLQVATVLRDLEHAKLIELAGTAYRLTGHPRERAAIEEFAAAYNSRPVTLIRAVYNRPSPVQSFADAFRIRRTE